jgi:DNA-binding XRE family transcriptional regulator
MRTHTKSIESTLTTFRVKQCGLTQEDIAYAVGASQSQVSRIFSGKTSPNSKLAGDICNYVSTVTRSSSRDAVVNNNELIDALSSVWDGTPHHARSLATIIRSLALLGTKP